MTRPDEAAIRAALTGAASRRVARVSAFERIDSTNAFLARAEAPAPGRAHAAVADHQTAGRGRRNREWLSAPGGSLCLSLAYTFEAPPEQLPPLTLALGVGVVEALAALGARDAGLKWPNDLISGDAKLGGILTESQLHTRDTPTVIAGIGINLELPDTLRQRIAAERAHPVTSLADCLDAPPERDYLAVCVIDAMIAALRRYDADGIEPFRERYRALDWLAGREVVVEAPAGDIAGIAAGVDATGALLVDSVNGRMRIVAGTVRYVADSGVTA